MLGRCATAASTLLAAFTAAGCAYDVQIFATPDGSVPPREPLQATAIGTGGVHTCAQTAEGVYCWGANQYGQLGFEPRGAANMFPDDVDRYGAPQRLDIGTSFASLIGGASFTCGIAADSGEVWCWGSNDRGELGNGDTTGARSVRPVRVRLPVGVRAVAISADTYHACAVMEDTSLHCWGDNQLGALGVDGPMLGPDPHWVPVDLGTGWSAVAAGELHTCAVRTGGELYCWGGNDWGQLGIAGTNLVVPTRVGDETGWTRISAGQHHSCGIQRGELSCFGAYPDGDDPYSEGPRPLTSGDSLVEVVSSWWQTCARRADGSAVCLGRNQEDQIILDGADRYRTPVALAEEDWLDLQSGYFHVCGIRSDHTILCRGLNSEGQLGPGDLADVHHAVPAIP